MQSELRPNPGLPKVDESPLELTYVGARPQGGGAQLPRLSGLCIVTSSQECHMEGGGRSSFTVEDLSKHTSAGLSRAASEVENRLLAGTVLL